MTPSRPTEARALWITAPRRVALRTEPLRPAANSLHLRALWSGISRGTESLVFNDRVPPEEHAGMAGPNQGGRLPYPVKYGYALVAQVESPGPLQGETVFCLHPHQDRTALPPDAVIPLPAGLPPARAVLAANMETALNITWDAGIAPGDRVTVAGAGVVGALVAHLAARIPGTEVTLTDIAPGRATLAAALGAGFALAGAAPGNADVAINASASGEALAALIAGAGPEARIVEASWYGARSVTLPLGGAFHAGRLQIVSSQVGRIPPARAPRWDFRRRLTKALALLADDRLDALISGESDFDDLPADYARILDDPATLCHRVRY
ncbi:zinc-dependent alcohol dehydrogenase [Frigidibacter sp. MR17.24]|uniref:zinc-dependent alcohol dehydrogenase n=1 Tax=Frigidibacter sp. MR17.24 TaxID=3127345 RepID=UPI003012EB8E